MRVLHAIHDFLPRHRAGSEIYACDLARELAPRHDVFVLAAEYDPAAAHGTLRWRSYEGLPVIELVNNWEFDRFEDTYSSVRINAQLQHVLDATKPDVLHIHNLLNLSFDLPRLARERGVAVVATLHDYTMVCPSGGQRVHQADAHICTVIDPNRCSRCFPQSALGVQWAAGRITGTRGGRLAARGAAVLRRSAPALLAAAVQQLDRQPLDAGDITRRLAYARHVFDMVDLFVAPSAAMAEEWERLGMDASRLEVSDYGFPPPLPSPRLTRDAGAALRIGFVGTLVWHKGVHVLVEALAGLTGSFELHVYADMAVFPDYARRVRALASALPVTFHGGFGRDRLSAVYSSIDVLVVPSLWPENSPLVIHEAFEYGVAVVGARVGGIPGLVADGVNGLLYEPFSVESLCATLQRLIDDPVLAEQLASAAPAVKTIDQDAREWERRYARLQDMRRPPRAGPLVS
jgi:glycosyltransferase involved in cell wall biosynthesis